MPAKLGEYFYDQTLTNGKAKTLSIEASFARDFTSHKLHIHWHGMLHYSLRVLGWLMGVSQEDGLRWKAIGIKLAGR